MASADEETELSSGARMLGISLDDSARDRLLRYLDLIYVWNRSAGLTTVRRGDAVRLHLLDCLPVVRLLAPGRCADLGTGAGLPGLVLAMLRPDLDVELVESNRRKASFLMEVIRLEGIGNARVLECAVEGLPREGQYDIVVSRAFRHPPEFLSIAAPLVRPGGVVLLMAASLPPAEVAQLAAQSGLTEDASERFQLPGGSEPRTLVRFLKPA